MKKLFLSTIALFTLFISSSVSAMYHMTNWDDRFVNQPCYGLEAQQPNEKGYIISPGITLSKNKGPGVEESDVIFEQAEKNPQQIISVHSSTKTNSSTLSRDILEAVQSGTNPVIIPTIKCRIHTAEFYTSLYLSNFIPFGETVLIKYHYTHDGQDYFLKYNEEEQIFVPYTPEEWNNLYAQFGGNING